MRKQKRPWPWPEETGLVSPSTQAEVVSGRGWPEFLSPKCLRSVGVAPPL